MFGLTRREWALLACLALLIMIFRIPSFFDPWWYGDENIYMAVGQGIAKGQWLYSEVWDNKPPFIYLMYALSYTIFGSALWPLKVLNALLAVVGMAAFYLTSRKIFELGWRVSAVCTSVLAILVAATLEGTIVNAENIFVPLVWLGFFLLSWDLFKNLDNHQNEEGSLSSSGWFWIIFGSVCWSLAVFTKIQALLEVGMLGLLLFAIYLHSRKNWLDFWQDKFFWRFFGLVGLLTVLPYALVFLTYGLRGDLEILLFSMFGFGGDYIESGKDPIVFGLSLTFVSGVMLRAVLLLVTLVSSIWLFWQSKLSRSWFILINWLAIGMFVSLLSERNYPHYLLQVLPILVLAGALLWRFLTDREQSWQFRLTGGLLSVLILQTFLTTFTGGNFVWNYYSPQHYFGGFAQVTLGQRSLDDWQADYNQELVETQPIMVDTIQEYTEPEDKIYVVANRPDLYFLSSRLSGQPFVADYHYPRAEVPEILETIRANETKLIVIDKESDKAEAFYTTIQKNYVLREEVLDRYTFWLKK